MQIVMFSINPLFANVVMGGAPKHLRNIALHMGETGHKVTVLCTRVEGSDAPFNWHENVQVLPILRFKQPFPQPYEVPAYDLAAAVQDMGDILQGADRFYMHDGEFLFPYVYQNVPTVVSLRDNVYPETLIGGFLFPASKLVLISEYSKQYYLRTVGRFFPELKDRIQVIHNGLDWDKFKPTLPNKILELIPLDPTAQPIVIHPHRPEESKGIRQTIAVVDKLVHEYGFTNLIALAPQWLEVQLTPDLRVFYESILAEIAVRGLEKNFRFHGWIPQELMPEYYSMGTVMFSLGHFAESFGNAVYEALGCGTPAVVARITTHRELLPESLVDKVDYGDVDAAAALAARIIQNRERTQPATMAYLHTHYSMERQLNAYADAILNAEVVAPMPYVYTGLDEQTRFILAPWCYVTGQGIYHDFKASYAALKAFMPLFEAFPDGFTWHDAAQYSVSKAEVMEQYREGYLVPLS
ncbi:MAG: hypothetical protein OHK0046_39300 [Anaerolineae bacterium]